MNLKGIGFVLSLRCNIKCRHCAPRAGPEHTQEMASSDVCRWLEEAKKIDGMRLAEFTGGEPFIYKDLETVVAKAGELFHHVMVLTNAFWATDPERAKDVLSPLVAAGLNTLSISADDFHQEFVPLQSVRNAISAAKRLGIACVIQQAGYPKNSISPDELKCFRGKSLFLKYGVSPLGRAVDNHISSIDSVPFKILQSVGCPRLMDNTSLARTVVPNGNVYACDHASFLSYGRSNPFFLGNAHETTLSELIRKADEDPLFTAMATRGFRALIDVVRSKGLEDKLEKSYPHQCDLCAHLLGDGEMRAALQEFYSSDKHNHIVRVKTTSGEEIELLVRELNPTSLLKRNKLKRKPLSVVEKLNLALINCHFVDDSRGGKIDLEKKIFPLSVLSRVDCFRVFQMAYGPDRESAKVLALSPDT